MTDLHRIGKFGGYGERVGAERGYERCDVGDKPFAPLAFLDP